MKLNLPNLVSLKIERTSHLEYYNRLKLNSLKKIEVDYFHTIENIDDYLNPSQIIELKILFL